MRLSRRWQMPHFSSTPMRKARQEYRSRIATTKMLWIWRRRKWTKNSCKRVGLLFTLFWTFVHLALKDFLRKRILQGWKFHFSSKNCHFYSCWIFRIFSGIEFTERLTLGFLRCHWPLAPEEFICRLTAELLSEEAITTLAKSLGVGNCFLFLCQI